MNETLKAAGHIGAELGAARADNEMLRGLLEELHPYVRGCSLDLWDRYHAALSLQAEPVEPAPAQDELRKRFDQIEFEVAQGKHTAASVFTQMRTAAMYIRPAQTEQQPVATVKYGGYTAGNQLLWERGAGLQFLQEGTALYAGAIPQLRAVAYLDIGAGGYIDLGSDLTSEQLEALPWGRHMLGIIGTYGADGYVPATSSPAQTEQTEQQLVAVVDANDDGMWADILPNVTVKVGQMLYAAPIAQTAPQPEQSEQHERWTAMSGDWRETSAAIHGERSGYIACGIPEDKAHAIIKAHNLGLPEECAALSTPSPAMDAKEE